MKSNNPVQTLENCHNKVMTLLETVGKELLTKSKTHMEELAEEDSHQFEVLVTKLGSLYSDINDISRRINTLIAEIDSKSINLTHEDKQRVQDEEHVKEMFETFLPYFILFNISKSLTQFD